MTDLWKSFLSILKVIILSKPAGINKSEKRNEQCIILGNGPSLNTQIQNISNINQYDLFAVNYFSSTHYYEELKPLHYVIIAPEFWIEDASEDYKKNRDNTLESLVKKTSWKLFFYIPAQAKKSKYWQNILSKNNNIQIIFFNPTPVEGNKRISFFLFGKNFGMPRPHNVLIPSLMISINLGYKNIYLFGADHSWLKDIHVDENNLVLLTQKHFYNEKSARPKPMTNTGKGVRKLHEVLKKFQITFKNYFLIEEYSRKKNSLIFNSTKNSYIDAFERKYL